MGYVQGHGKALGTVSGASLTRKITNTSSCSPGLSYTGYCPAHTLPITLQIIASWYTIQHSFTPHSSCIQHREHTDDFAVKCVCSAANVVGIFPAQLTHIRRHSQRIAPLYVVQSKIALIVSRKHQNLVVQHPRE